MSRSSGAPRVTLDMVAPGTRLRRERSAAIMAIEGITAAIGITLMVAAVSANQAWLDRHFLPSFFIPRQWYVVIETAVRAAIGTAGAVLILGRSRLAHSLTRAPMLAVTTFAAAVLAIGSGELVLRWRLPQPTEWLMREEEPRRQEDSQLGWVLVPARTGRSTVSGRIIEYAIDTAGYRVRTVYEPTDVKRR